MFIDRVTKAAVVCCLGVLAMAGAARAQMGMGMARNIPAMGGVFNPTVGVGADYDMTTAKGEQMKMSFAVVGKDSIDGKPGYWMEIGFSGGKVPGTMYMKSLSVVDSSGQMATQRMIMQMNGQAYQMPDQMVKMNSRTTQTNIASDGQDLGSESVTVPAGTFMAEHWRSKDGDDYWTTKDAGPWGLVKMKSKDGTTMVLTKTYTDAKDQITGTPQPFPGMGGRNQ
jgi:hypothetical protein